MTDQSSSSSVIKKKRVFIHRQTREMAKNVLDMCIEERQNNNLTFTLNNAYDRASRYTGLSKRTLAAIQNEAKKGPLCSPSKRKRPCNKKTNLNVDDFDRGVIHRIIEEFYLTKKIVPTCIKLLAAIREKIEFPWGVTSLRKLLKDMGYRWLKLKEVTELALTQVTEEDWRGFDDHVIILEENYWQRDGLIEDTIDRFIIAVSDGEDSETDSSKSYRFSESDTE
ncbi:hypothetical protein ACJJTC_002116 [Scirpophaga incertulas]